MESLVPLYCFIKYKLYSYFLPTYLNNMVYSVVISVPYIHTYGLQNQAKTLFLPLDSDGTSHHGISGAAHGTGAAFCYSTARGAVAVAWGEEGGGEGGEGRGEERDWRRGNARVREERREMGGEVGGGGMRPVLFCIRSVTTSIMIKLTYRKHTELTWSGW